MSLLSLKNVLLGVGGVALVAATGFQMARHAFESPDYNIVASNDGVEVRRYAPRIVAETTVEMAEQSAATSEGFNRLAGYIFGGNTRSGGGSDKIAMTTPVEARPAEARSQKIAMTSPVEATPETPGQWVIAFTMPSTITLDNAPTPDDSRVTLRELAPETVAAYTFRGRSDDAQLDTARDALLKGLEGTDYEPIGAVTIARYDPPSVLPPFRRNEVIVPVRKR